jgi:hypothetical protein
VKNDFCLFRLKAEGFGVVDIGIFQLVGHQAGPLGKVFGEDELEMGRFDLVPADFCGFLAEDDILGF